MDHFKHSFLMLMIIFFSFVLCSQAQLLVDTPTWSIEAKLDSKTKLPVYSFHRNSAPSDVYDLTFYETYEAQEKNGDLRRDEESLISFSKLKWDIPNQSELDNVTETVTFTISTNETDRFKSLRLVNSLSSKNLTNAKILDCNVSIHIDDYTWRSNSSKLSLTLSLNRRGKNDTADAELISKTIFQLGNAFFQTGISADQSDNSRSVPVSLSTVVEDSTQVKKVIIVYDHFVGNLTHQPMFGLGHPSDHPSVQKTILTVVCVTAVVVVALLGLIATIIIKRHRRHYMRLAQEGFART